MLLYLIVVVGLLALAAAVTVRFVPDYQRLVVYRVGQGMEVLGPGLVVVIPLLDHAVRVDLREMFLEMPHQACYTRDGASITVDFLIYWRTRDPLQSVHAVQNFASALHGLASATVRTLVGEMDLERVLGKREALNEALRARLDAVTRNWGIEVTMVHLRDVVRPPEVYEAMSRQLQAEWNRRAALIEAQGRKEVTVLTAEADREAAVRRAEGERQALAIRLGGLAEGLEQLDAVAASFRPQTVALQYLETLKELAASPASKVVVPVEISALLKSSLVESDGVSARG